MHLAHLFKNIVEKYPNNTALVYNDEVITYADLDRRSVAIWGQLQRRGLKVGGRVGLLFNNPVNFIVAMLGVVKSSAVYVPFDNRDSTDNISSLCQLTQVDILLYDNAELDLAVFQDFSPYFIQKDFDNDQDYLSHDKSDVFPGDIDPVLYIMFTSGTTSRVPKGVLINHSGVSRFISDNAAVKVDHTDTILQASSVAFDASTFEIWNALLNGAKLVLVDNNFEYMNLGETLHKNKISILWLTTKLFETLIVSDSSIFESLKYIIFGGEACTYKHIISAYKRLGGVQLVNGYGPTENTVFTTMHLVNDNDLDRDFIPIGKAVNQTECYVLDDALDLVAEGDTGVLYVSGDGLAYSYLDKPPIDEKFIFHVGLNKRLYNTGDVVAFSSEYGYQYIGRSDRQVKVRGYRIELDVIESTACGIDNISHAFAVYNSEILNHGLVLFYTTKNSKPLDNKVIKQYLDDKLPWYSLPSLTQFVDRIPYTNTNKVDVHKLVDDYRANVNQLANVAEGESVDSIWMSVLQISEINPDDNFFDSGGDSLSSLLLMGQVNKAFGLNLKTNYLLNNPSFRKFSANLYNQLDCNSDVVLMKSGIMNTPVFLIPPLGGGSEMYYRLAMNLDVKNDVYGFNELLDLDRNREKNEHLIDSKLVTYLAKTYTSSITASMQVNKVILAGHSLGGNIAIAMIRELNDAGIEVAQIHLIDTYKLGNTSKNSSHEIGFRLGFLRRSMSFLRDIVFKFQFNQFKFLVNSCYKPEINRDDISGVPVFLYRCNDISLKLHDPESLDWRKTIKQLSVIKVNSDHLTVLKGDNVKELSCKMSDSINSGLLEQAIQIDNPESLSLEQYDTYLARGWLRYKQQVFTNDKSTHKGIDYPVIWLRYNLDLLKVRKSHKQIRQLNKAYRCIVTDLDYEKFKDEIEGLYKKYRSGIDFETEETAYDLLYNRNNTKDIFTSKSISLYDDDKLIGIGFFDLGEKSGAQVLNFYDPSYAKSGIGKHLTLETLKYLQSINYKHFYVGFKYVGHTKMDYKLFVGEDCVEYLDVETQQWKPQ